MKRFRAVLDSNWFFPFIFGLVSLFSIRWFKGEEFILAGDLGWPLDFKRFFDLTLYVWDRSVAPGYLAMRQSASLFPFALYGYIFDLLGFSSSLFQKVIYLISFFFSGYGFYLLMRELKASKIPSFISGLFYMLSPYALLVTWNPSYGQTFPFYSFFPLVVFFYLRYLHSKHAFSPELFAGLLLSFMSFIGASFSNPAFFIMLFGGFVLISIYIFIVENYTLKDIVVKFLLYGFFYLLLNMFWILPLLGDVNTAFSGADNARIGVVNDANTQYINSVSYSDGFRLSGLWPLHSKYLGDYYYTFHEFFNSSFYIISSYLFIFLSIVLYMRTKNKGYAFIFLIFLLVMLLNTGLKGNSLFKNFTEIVYHFPYFGRIFRSVYLKFGIPLVFSFALLFGLLLNKFNKGFFNTLLIVVIIIHAYPFFTGSILKGPGMNMPSYSVTIPEDYYLISDFINKDNQEFKVLVLPVPVGYNFHLKWGNSDGYNGADFLRTLLHKPIYYQGGLPSVKFLHDNFTVSSIGNANTKYVILRKDIYAGALRKNYLTNDWNKIFSLVDTPNVIKVIETDNLVLYEIPRKEFKPLFYSNDNEDIISFEQISPVKFKVLLRSTNSATTLFFNEGISDSWKATVTSMPEVRINREHSSNLINSWYLFGSGNYEIVIYNSSQGFLSLGIVISILTFLVLLIFLVRGVKYVG